MSILSVKYEKSLKCLVYILQNDQLKDHREALKLIFYTLVNDPQFKNFGNNKIVLTTVITEGLDKPFHHNVLINKKTIFEDFYKQVKDDLNIYQDDFSEEVFLLFKVRVWNMDKFVNKDNKIT